MASQMEPNIPRSLRRHAIVSFALIAGLGGGLLTWAATTEVSGAVIASGVVAVEGGSKRVQHPDGGVVKEILVRDESVVKAGQPVVRLDDTMAAAVLESTLSQIRDSIARQSRLTAESAGLTELVLPAFAAEWQNDPLMAALLASEERLLASRAASLEGRLVQSREQITQLEQQISGLDARHTALKAQLAIVSQDEAGLENLARQGLVTSQRINETKLRKAELEGEIGQLLGQIASARASIAERKVAMSTTEEQFRGDVMTELLLVSQTVNELLQQKIAAEDRLSRLVIRAPIDGVVHQSSVQTIGGVVDGGETLMMIVPQEDGLMVNARISPLDIDKLVVGQDVVVRLAGMSNRFTADLNAAVTSISPDLTMDPVTQAEFYFAKVELPEGEFAKLPEGTRLIPGMPAETFMKTADRTVLSYLVEPFTDQVDYMFRED